MNVDRAGEGQGRADGRADIAREASVTNWEFSVEKREKALGVREEAASLRESSVALREKAVQLREVAFAYLETARPETEAARAGAGVDMTDLRVANEHLVIATLAARELKEAAEDARLRQDEFIAMLAHELRNPLAPLTNALRVLERSTRLNGVVRNSVCEAERLVHGGGRCLATNDRGGGQVAAGHVTALAS